MAAMSPTAAEIVAEMEAAWQECARCSPAPSFIVLDAQYVPVRVKWRGKRMTRKVITWPAGWGKCPRWAKESAPGVH